MDLQGFDPVQHSNRREREAACRNSSRDYDSNAEALLLWEYDRAMHLSDHAFRRLVDEALDQVPEEFRFYLKGVPVVIEGWPPDDILDALGVPEDGTLYGLYSGHPITEGPPGSGELPPRITIFRAPLLEDCEDEAELRDEVTTTILHEIAHHFGIGEARLKELGLD